MAEETSAGCAQATPLQKPQDLASYYCEEAHQNDVGTTDLRRSVGRLR